jgi:exopolysaccharide biosynthesis polyprenyl glycosylphosphotransferase
MRGTFFKWHVMLMDLATLIVGFILCFQLFNLNATLDQNLNTIVMLLILAGAVLFVFSLFDLYTDWRRKSIQNSVYSIVLSMLVVYIGFTLFTFLSPDSYKNDISIAFLFTIETVFIVLLRAAIWFIDKKMCGKRKVAIIGSHERSGEALAEKFQNHNEGWFEVEGILTVEDIREAELTIDQYDIFVLSSEIHKEQKDQIVRYCLRHGKEVMVVPEFIDLTVQGAFTQQVDDMPFISLSPPKLSLSANIFKRVFDIAVSTVLLICLSPIIFLLYICIPLTSKGPAVFKQERIGLNGNPFWIYKFRSMIEDAEMKTGPVLASEKDPRITLFGRLMRATRLDELPQLLNVLKGDMSLVGPRPEREFFIEKFKQQLPDYTLRLTVKPGITGFAQVQGNYSTSVEDKLRYDLMYIRNYSLILDVKILLQTIRVVIQPKQARGIKEPNVKRDLKLVSVEKKESAVSR